MKEYYPIEQPEEISIRNREDAMGAYLMMFAAIGAGLPLPILNLLAAIIYYYVNRNKGRFVDFHLRQSLFSQIPVTLLNAGLVIWGVRILFSNSLEFSQTFVGYLIVVAAANLLYFIFSIIAALKARKGRMYYFLFFGKLCYHMTYKIKPEREHKPVNTPPKI